MVQELVYSECIVALRHSFVFQFDYVFQAMQCAPEIRLPLFRVIRIPPSWKDDRVLKNTYLKKNSAKFYKNKK